MADLFRQRISVQVGELVYNSWRVDDQGRPQPGFNISFDVARSSKPKDPSKGRVVITNPPEDQALALATGRIRRPVVRALFGYASTGLGWLAGGQVEVDGAQLSYGGADTLLSLSFVDGLAALRTAYLSLKVPAGAKASEAFALVAGAAGLPVGTYQLDPADDYRLARAYTVEGGLADVLGRLATALNVDASIQDGELVVLSKRQTLQGEAQLFSTENGRLIGKPSPKGRDGALFDLVCEPSLRPGTRFRVESPTSYGTGVWKVITTRSRGTTYQAAVTTVEAKASP
jgi:hypothetical protein